MKTYVGFLKGTSKDRASNLKFNRICCMLMFSMLIFLGACSAESSSDKKTLSQADKIKMNITDNLDYQLDNLTIDPESSTSNEYKINAEISATTETEYTQADFVPFTKELVKLSEDAAEELGASISYVNSVMHTGENSWIGWESSYGMLYIQGEIVSKGVTLDSLQEQVDALNTDGEISESNNDVDKFGDMLEPFQGEWEHIEDAHTQLIINGKEVNYIHTNRDGEVFAIYTFYFDFDEKENLIVANSHAQARYKFELDENGQLIANTISDDSVEKYAKVSDNTLVPQEPFVGMTENELSSITWGEPKGKNDFGSMQQWEYIKGKIYLTDGIVTSIQESKEPFVGMTESEALLSTWGTPKKRNTTTTAGKTCQQWVYDNGYLYIENGIVTAIQEK